MLESSYFWNTFSKFSIGSENLRLDFELPETLKRSDLIKNIDSAIEEVNKVYWEYAPCLWSATKHLYSIWKSFATLVHCTRSCGCTRVAKLRSNIIAPDTRIFRIKWQFKSVFRYQGNKFFWGFRVFSESESKVRFPFRKKKSQNFFDELSKKSVVKKKVPLTWILFTTTQCETSSRSWGLRWRRGG